MRSISSTPLLDIISRFPLVGGRVFYKLMTFDTKNGEIDDKILFEEFDVAIINQAREYFKSIYGLYFILWNINYGRFESLQSYTYS